MMVDKKEIGDNFSEWVILKRIIVQKQKKFKSIEKLARKIETDRRNPTFIKVLKCLEYEGIMKILNIEGMSKEIEIDLKKLNKYTRERVPFKIVDDFIQMTVLGHYTG